MKILVVDDEHILRTRLKSVLEQSGLPLSAVFTAENALNAIECIEKEQPQIVITDIRMPISTRHRTASRRWHRRSNGSGIRWGGRLRQCPSMSPRRW